MRKLKMNIVFGKYTLLRIELMKSDTESVPECGSILSTMFISHQDYLFHINAKKNKKNFMALRMTFVLKWTIIRHNASALGHNIAINCIYEQAVSDYLLVEVSSLNLSIFIFTNLGRQGHVFKELSQPQDLKDLSVKKKKKKDSELYSSLATAV